jgi:hypothetical protein
MQGVFGASTCAGRKAEIRHFIAFDGMHMLLSDLILPVMHVHQGVLGCLIWSICAWAFFLF